MKKTVLLLAVLLIFAGCAKEPTQEDVNAAMDMIIQVYYSGIFATQYEQTIEGMEITQDEGTDNMHFEIKDLELAGFYEEFFIENELIYSSMSGTIDITPEGTSGNIKLKGGIIKNLQFSNSDGVLITANGYEFNGITD